MTNKKEYSRIYKIGYDNAMIDIKNFIEIERDNGNMYDEFKGTALESENHGFSAGICLSNLLKFLEEKLK